MPPSLPEGQPSIADNVATNIPHNILAIGIGINLASHPDQARIPAISLRALGFDPARLKPEDFLPLLLDSFNHYHQMLVQQGFLPLRDAWLAQAVGLGEAMTARLPDGEIHGRFLTIDETGCLLLRQQEGIVRRIAAGDVLIMRK